jgi:hypothetical protein
MSSYQVEKSLGEQFVHSAICADGHSKEEKIHDGLEVRLVVEEDGLSLRHEVAHEGKPVGEDAGNRLVGKAVAPQFAHPEKTTKYATGLHENRSPPLTLFKEKILPLQHKKKNFFLTNFLCLFVLNLLHLFIP